MELEKLIKIIQTVSESELTGFKYEEKGMKLHLTKQQEKVVAVPREETVYIKSEQTGRGEDKKEGQEPCGNVIVSPLVGTFYAAPSEQAEPFVSVGDSVKKGQILAIVEAMKLMNEIESEYDGTVTEIFVDNGQAVEYGQPLFRICSE